MQPAVYEPGSTDGTFPLRHRKKIDARSGGCRGECHAGCHAGWSGQDRIVWRWSGLICAGFARLKESGRKRSMSSAPSSHAFSLILPTCGISQPRLPQPHRWLASVRSVVVDCTRPKKGGGFNKGDKERLIHSSRLRSSSHSEAIEPSKAPWCVRRGTVIEPVLFGRKWYSTREK